MVILTDGRMGGGGGEAGYRQRTRMHIGDNSGHYNTTRRGYAQNTRGLAAGSEVDVVEVESSKPNS